MSASIEATLELWASSLRDVKGRIRPLFTQVRIPTIAAIDSDRNQPPVPIEASRAFR